jgi:hypothetical protein
MSERPHYTPGADPLGTYPQRDGADNPWGWAASQRRQAAGYQPPPPRCSHVHGPLQVRCEKRAGHDGPCWNGLLHGGEFNRPDCKHEAEGLTRPTWCYACGAEMP